tara:strand:+ start:11013 stop:12050 length:1038 start_codon:yes stop_codon:yes gene_type:complete
MNILVTGCAGFIGYHLTRELLMRGDTVIGVDNINEYYDVSLKYGRLKQLGINFKKDSTFVANENLVFHKIDISQKDKLEELFKDYQLDAVCNLAAQAGVRYSLSHPDSYIKSNIDGFLNILECCRNYEVKNLSYASSSSVYGLNENYPFSVGDNVDHPISLYAATKKSNELMAHTYSHLFGINTTGLRFFTVYGPWGRPDMALFKFTKAAFSDEEIEIYNNGEMERDFTYVSDIIKGLIAVVDNPAKIDAEWNPVDPTAESSSAPYRIYNIGNNNPVNLMEFVSTLEEAIGKKIRKKYLPLQPGDVTRTYANVDSLEKDFDYRPQTDIRKGISEFVDWYRSFYEK